MRPCSGMRMAGRSSFCTNRWVFSDTEEKYTRLHSASADTATSFSSQSDSTRTRSGDRLCAQRGLGQRLDAVGPETRPVLVTGDDDRGLQVAQRHHVVAGLGVERDVDFLVGDALVVQRLVGGVALHARGLGVHGDAHGRQAPQRIVDNGRMMVRLLLSASRQSLEFPSFAAAPGTESVPFATIRSAGVSGLCRCLKHYT